MADAIIRCKRLQALTAAKLGNVTKTFFFVSDALAK
jgi:hypothetical protein